MSLAPTVDDKARNPFFRLAADERNNQALRGSRKQDAIVLALAFRSAHNSSDVWAMLRFERALNEYKTASLGTYLDGCYFTNELLSDGETFADLEALKFEAEEFLAETVEY